MSDFRDLSVAVFGCGHWGKNLVRNFHEIGALKAISDPDPAICQRMEEAHGVASGAVEEILARDDIDAVVIAAPAELHHPLALKALLADKHVYIEKPICLDLEEAQEICDTAERQKKTLMVGHLLQYHPAFLKLKEMVRQGELGDIRYIYSRRQNIGKLRVHENVLWSFAPHDISMILALAGSAPEKVVGFAGNFLQESISDFATVQMEFPSKIKAHIEASWLNPFKEQRLVVVGEHAMAEFNDLAEWPEKLKIYRHNARITDGVPLLDVAEAELVDVEFAEPLRSECEHFLKFIANKETPFTDGREAIEVLRVLQAGDASEDGWKGVNLS